MVTVKCVICGKEFESLKSTKKYCSKECENANRRLKYAQAKAQGLDPHNKGLSEKECLICNKKFEYPPPLISIASILKSKSSCFPNSKK